ncbi:hypothetical protein E1B06_14815 [Brevibacillus laterosporus]|uniref:hypothetical protein n=1 Tax=Brevibacillus laterosporus TaxID=1465 RepID=UPI00240750DE|nr:hypothetical protein [Brevibacillus laterosporus]MDF9412955.1 hypothetical protein [Brevibacillus laterosporus]
MNNTILLEQFREKQVRIVRKSSKEAMIPINDIADAIDYERSTLHKLLKRNEEVLGRFKGMVITPTPGGPQEILSLNRDGVLGLLMKLDYHRINDEYKRQTIIDFQIWSIETLGRVLDGEVPNQDFQPWVEQAEQHLRFASVLAESSGVKTGIALATAITEAEKETGRSLEPYRQLLPSATHDIGNLTASDIGKKIGKSAQKVNQALLALGLQKQEIDFKDRKSWRLTSKGKTYGEEYPFVRNGHSGYQIRWNEAVLSLLSDIQSA